MNERRRLWNLVNDRMTLLEREIRMADGEISSLNGKLRFVAPHVRPSTLHTHRAQVEHKYLANLLRQLRTMDETEETK